ncbi:cholecystokinin receptor type A-like isoform X3 [Ruditapes philippinarum]|uniref:cholecystokinin receptor type A-like isoform X3 n=1 Tax=Ruditapes philippinarum TaxID=129788 RepID=UPI00295C399E|nr:cholecystokinin receptor type A-like isoform X3 [Ruditapes philippinarum]
MEFNKTHGYSSSENGSINFNFWFNYTFHDNGTDLPEFVSPRLKMEDMITLPLYSLIFVLSLAGNLLVIMTLVQNKRMRTITNMFLLNLSISDLLLAVFCMPFTIVPIMLKNFIFGATMCVLIRYMQIISVSVSCFTLVAISMERYFAICRPFSSRKWQTLSHSYRTIAVCWIAAFIIGVPTAIFNKYTLRQRGNATCREVWPDPLWYKMYTVFLDIILLVLPIIIMTLSYCTIAYTLWSGMQMDKQEIEAQNGNGAIFKLDSVRKNESTIKDGFGRTIGPSDLDELNKPIKASTKARFVTRTGIRQTNNERSRAAKKRVIKMLFAVVLEFFVCWSPLFILQTWMTFDIKHATENLSQFILTSTYVLGYISSCCNPITYCFMNKNFRNGFKSAFRCCYRGSVRGRNEMPSYFQQSTTRTGVSHAMSYDKVNTKDDSDEL